MIYCYQIWADGELIDEGCVEANSAQTAEAKAMSIGTELMALDGDDTTDLTVILP